MQMDERQRMLVETRLFGDVARHLGDYPEALRLLNQCLALLDPSNLHHRSVISRWLGLTLLHLGNYDEAVKYLRDSLTGFVALNRKHAVAACVASFGVLAVESGDLVRAARLFAACEAIARKFHTPLNQGDMKEWSPALDIVRRRLDEPSLATAWVEGSAMTMQQAIDAALGLANQVDNQAPYDNRKPA
jgi:tetratricopeptide (TPR) repeat protein